MTTGPVAPRPSRTPWIIAGVLGCLVVCLLLAIAGGSGYFLFFSQSQPTAAVQVITPTRTSFGLPTSTLVAVVPAVPTVVVPTIPTVSFPTVPSVPTAAAQATQVAVLPTPTPAPPTATAVPPTATKPPAPTGKIAFSKREGDRPEDMYIWIMNMDGTGAKKILDRASEPSFSPDGTKLAYFHWTDGIYIANADGTNPQKIVGESYSGLLDWSHDGRFIAYSASPGSGSNVFIKVVPPDVNALKTPAMQRDITIGIEPSWSPDDTQMAFRTCSGSTCGIFKVSSNGGDPIPVVGDDGDLPDWSPDGKRIVYQKEQDGGKQLFVINVDGTGKKQLTSGAAMHVDAAWSADGNYIFYRSPEGGAWGIWRMNSDGSNPIKLADNMVPVSWPQERLAVTR